MESGLPDRRSQRALATGTVSMTSPEADKIASDLKNRARRPRLRTLLSAVLVAELIVFLSLGTWLLWLLGYLGLLIGAILAVSGLALGWLCWRFFVAAYRRRFQFSLRSLLILVAVASLGMGLLVKPLNEYRRKQAEYRRKQAELRAFKLANRLGGEVMISLRSDEDPAEDGWADIRFDGIRLDGVDLQDLDGYPGFRLGLTNTSVSEEVVTHLRVLRNLKYLDLSGSKVDDAALVRLKGLPSLRGLILMNTSITDDSLRHLEGLVNVRSLFLDGTQVTGAGLSHLKSLSNLDVLSLRNTPVTDEGLEHLKELKRLAYLYLKSTRVTDAGLPHLKELRRLEFLDLTGTGVTDAGLPHLEGLRQLKCLSLRGTPVSDEAASKLQSALPDCKVLR